MKDQVESKQVSQARDLALTRFIDAPRELVWRAWTEPEHLKQWWAPKPWETVGCELELRPGGRFRTVMRGPDGTEIPGDGVFLEIVEHERIVFTDALIPGYRPAENPFMTVIITLEEHGGGTNYTARVLHKDAANREKHEAMGFFEGWGTCLKQLAALVERLKEGVATR